MHRRNALWIAALAGALSFLPTAAAIADTEIVTSNESDEVESDSGDATASNSGTAQVGHQGGGSSQVGSSEVDDDAEAQDIANNQATNVQEGDNELDASQNATADTGDTVGGQVIGAVSDGALSIDGTNLSRDVDLESGDATATNDFAAFVGLSNASQTALGADDILNADATNVQAGDNDSSLFQNTDASSGDAVGGQVVGGTSTGPTDIVLANTSDDASSTSGDADESNDTSSFTGLAASGTIDLV
jgi:hypothetical protein